MKFDTEVGKLSVELVYPGVDYAKGPKFEATPPDAVTVTSEWFDHVFTVDLSNLTTEAFFGGRKPPVMKNLTDKTLPKVHNKYPKRERPSLLKMFEVIKTLTEKEIENFPKKERVDLKVFRENKLIGRFFGLSEIQVEAARKYARAMGGQIEDEEFL